MAQFDVYRNANAATRASIPYLLDVQSDLLEPIATRVVVPLCKPEVLGGKLAERLNPLFEIEGRKAVMLTPELAGVSAKILGERICSLSSQRPAIIAALDLLFTGI
ncbi:MAG: CcdB family protein [Betaproteobacteria bacterium]|nr:CcdB family protein [Betaproteobacteria bacterium]